MNQDFVSLGEHEERRRNSAASITAHTQFSMTPSYQQPLSLTIPPAHQLTNPFTPPSFGGHGHSPMECFHGLSISPTSTADYLSPITPADLLAAPLSGYYPYNMSPIAASSPWETAFASAPPLAKVHEPKLSPVHSVTQAPPFLAPWDPSVQSNLNAGYAPYGTESEIQSPVYAVPQAPSLMFQGNSSDQPDLNSGYMSYSSHLEAPPLVHGVAQEPSFICQWNSCGQSIPLDQNLLNRHLREHMVSEPTLPTRERVCRWTGCVCAAKTAKSGRCKDQPMGQHPTHVQYVEQHVWDVHAGLRWHCNRCFQADFTTKRSMERHQSQGGCSGTPGTTTATLFCASCRTQLQNQAEMNAHARCCTGPS